MTQSNIPAPTPADDIVPHQERIEYLIDQLTDRATLERKVFDKAYNWELVPGSDVRESGPAPVLDENVGGLIGDIAYVVSGWVWNAGALNFTLHPEDWTGVQLLDVGSHAVNVGDKFATAVANPTLPDRSHYQTVTVAGTVIVAGANDWTWQAPYGSSNPTFVGNSYWPFIERFDFAQKKWLPRIPIEYAAEGGIGGIIDGKLYFGGGDGNDITGLEFFVFDPASAIVTRLPDLPENPDYNPYGVVNGKLWWFSGTDAYSYDPQANVWSPHTTVGNVQNLAGDQCSGFEIDGKLWFYYSGKVGVFDPSTLTFTPKTTSTSGGGPVFLISGKFTEFLSGDPDVPGRGTQTYDPETDTWVSRADIANDLKSFSAAQFVGVTYEDTPYLLSATHYNESAGVYGLTKVTYDRPAAKRLLPEFPPNFNFVPKGERYSQLHSVILHSGAQRNPEKRTELTRGDAFLHDQVVLPITTLNASQRIFALLLTYANGVTDTPPIHVVNAILKIHALDGSSWCEAALSDYAFTDAGTVSHGDYYARWPVVEISQQSGGYIIRPDGYSVEVPATKAYSAVVEFDVQALWT